MFSYYINSLESNLDDFPGEDLIYCARGITVLLHPRQVIGHRRFKPSIDIGHVKPPLRSFGSVRKDRVKPVCFEAKVLCPEGKAPGTKCRRRQSGPLRSSRPGPQYTGPGSWKEASRSNHRRNRKGRFGPPPGSRKIQQQFVGA